MVINTLRPKQNGLHLADNFFKYIFFGKSCILIEILLKFVTMSQNNFKPDIDDGSAPVWCQIIIWTNDGIVY